VRATVRRVYVLAVCLPRLTVWAHRPSEDRQMRARWRQKSRASRCLEQVQCSSVPDM
jgi:hypothetical protein